MYFNVLVLYVVYTHIIMDMYILTASNILNCRVFSLDVLGWSEKCTLIHYINTLHTYTCTINHNYINCHTMQALGKSSLVLQPCSFIYTTIIIFVCSDTHIITNNIYDVNACNALPGDDVLVVP